MSHSKDEEEKSGEKTPLLVSKGSVSELEDSRSTISSISLPPEEKSRIRVWTGVFVAVVVVVIIIAVSAIVALAVLQHVNRTHGAVSSYVEQCSEVGADILQKGGHAVDAAIATMLCIGLVSAQSSGIGGGGFMLIKDRNSYSALDFRETAPQSATFDMFAENETLADFGGLAVGIPGELRGMYMAWERFGRLPWNEVIQPTIDLANDGFYVTGHTARSVAVEMNRKLAYSSKLRNIYAPGGIPVKEGDVLKRPDLASVLDTIAEEGIDAFYNGSLTQDIIAAVEKTGGNITAEDLNSYRAHWKEPLQTTYHDQTVYAVPAPSGGPVFLSVISILEGYNLQPIEMDDSLTYHRTIEALKYGFAQKTRLGDPHYVSDIEEITEIMLNKTMADSLRLKIDDKQTFPPEHYGPYFPKPDQGTSHVCVIDSDDNMVTFTSTVGDTFGSGVVTENGILLNNEMDDFQTTIHSANMSQANIIEPGKRPQSSTTPVISHEDMKTGHAYMLLGGSGGWRILNDVTNVYLNLFSYGLSLKDAVDRLRVQSKLYPDNIVVYEEGLPGETVSNLQDKGHVMVKELLTSSVMVAMDKHHVMSAYSDQRTSGSGYVVF